MSTSEPKNFLEQKTKSEAVSVNLNVKVQTSHKSCDLMCNMKVNIVIHVYLIMPSNCINKDMKDSHTYNARRQMSS